jgi:hypothetical protein
MNIVRNDRGVVLVFVAMGLLLFLLFLGLALDTGWLVYVRAQGQARVDSAALAAAAALIESEDRRPSRAEELANAFNETNTVVNDTVNPENGVTPMKYDETDGSLRETGGSWALWSGSSPVCNAVRVTTSVPTPVFFAGIRNVFGAGETGLEDLTFSSVSHLPCPGIKTTDVKLARRLAISKVFWNLSAGCNEEQPRLLADLIGTVSTALAQVAPDLLVPVQVGTPITLQSIPDLDSLQQIEPCDGAVIVPVVDDVTPGSKRIKGFAAICRTTGTGGVITVKLQCGEVAPSSAGIGECFGTYASNPILIQ